MAGLVPRDALVSRTRAYLHGSVCSSLLVSGTHDLSVSLLAVGD